LVLRRDLGTAHAERVDRHRGHDFGGADLQRAAVAGHQRRVAIVGRHVHARLLELGEPRRQRPEQPERDLGQHRRQHGAEQQRDHHERPPAPALLRSDGGHAQFASERIATPAVSGVLSAAS
jgi:hypothetical protein